MSTNETQSDSERELQILVVMRQVLSSIVRDTTPPPGMQHPLQTGTIEDIKQCFALITAREKEINLSNGDTQEHRPRFKDEPRTSQVVPFSRPAKDGE